jgi:chromosome segregation ATPase
MIRKIHITHLLNGFVIALLMAAPGLAQGTDNRSPDTRENATVTLKVQASSVSDFETEAEAEKRAEKLRAKLLDLHIQEMHWQASLEELNYRLTPESMKQTLVFIGSTRPIDERLEALRARLENEKARVNKQLELLAATQEKLEAAISRAEAEVERLRQRD